MNDRLLLIIMSIALYMGQHSTAAINLRRCRRLKNFEVSNETGAAIKLTWKISDGCQPSYNITFGTVGGSLNSTFFKLENKGKQITKVLENLIPEKEYMILVAINCTKNETFTRRPIYQMSGRASLTSPDVNLTSSSDSSGNGVGGIVGGVVAFALSVVMVVAIGLLSVWLINRRRKQRNRNGLHYISVVQGIGNESRRGQLHSRPGYLQIVNEAYCAGYEIPRSSLIIRPAATKYPRREVRACADSNSSIDSVQVTTENIQTSSVGIDLQPSSVGTNCANGQIIDKSKKKLVKPYAVIDIKDIGNEKAASHGVLDRLKAKRQKYETLPSNREALKKSFGLCLENSTSQVEQPSSSTGRYHTVPIYVNLNIPMTVNPSYNKNKV